MSLSFADPDFDELIETWPPPADGETFADFPAGLEFLFEPHRYKVLRGGRGGAKSWSMAGALVIIGAQVPIRVLCARETMSSMRESVHRLLKDQIGRFGLTGYSVDETRIWHANGTEFTFAGLKNNIMTIKSYEGADVVWVEEAANVSKASWDVLIPTIRKDHAFGTRGRKAEIWVSFNPILRTDDTFRRFVVEPPVDCVCKEINWRDNPWFTETMRVDMEHMRRTDPDNFDHIWEGKCRSSVEGAIFGEEMKQADREGRICSVPFSRRNPVDTVWDLGFKDRNAIWFVQAYGGYYNFIDYIEDKGKTIQEYLVMLQQRAQKRGYLYGTHWLPHDGVDAVLHGKHLTGSPHMSPEMIMRDAGFNVRIVVKLNILTRINAGRMIFPNSRFDEAHCHQGIEAIRMYQWKPATSTKLQSGAIIPIEPSEPLHDQYSHGADAFTEAAVCIQEAPPPEPKPVYEQEYYSGEYNPYA